MDLFHDQLVYLPRSAIRRVTEFYVTDSFFDAALDEFDTAIFRDESTSPTRRLTHIRNIEKFIIPQYTKAGQRALLSVGIVQRFGFFERFCFASRNSSWVGLHRKQLNKTVEWVRRVSLAQPLSLKKTKPQYTPTCQCNQEATATPDGKPQA